MLKPYPITEALPNLLKRVTPSLRTLASPHKMKIWLLQYLALLNSVDQQLLTQLSRVTWGDLQSMSSNPLTPPAPRSWFTWSDSRHQYVLNLLPGKSGKELILMHRVKWTEESFNGDGLVWASTLSNRSIIFSVLSGLRQMLFWLQFVQHRPTPVSEPTGRQNLS